uniref:Uncharacterized protein n=1 Tax=Gouania willdenowi TaxID=441366 RepID=A0A8C5GN43_GOUWI
MIFSLKVKGIFAFPEENARRLIIFSPACSNTTTSECTTRKQQTCWSTGTTRISSSPKPSGFLLTHTHTQSKTSFISHCWSTCCPWSYRKAGAKCLVHCKMGVSRSASTVIAYAMKEYGWDLDTAFDFVKEKRAVTKPNPSFMKQLEEYQGILLARCALVLKQMYYYL